MYKFKHEKLGWVTVAHTFKSQSTVTNALVVTESGKTACIDIAELNDVDAELINDQSDKEKIKK